MPNSRRIAQALTRREVRDLRRQLAKQIEQASGLPHAEVHGSLGFMFNRAPAEVVATAVLRSLRDPDPLARAMELIAKRAA